MQKIEKRNWKAEMRWQGAGCKGGASAPS